MRKNQELERVREELNLRQHNQENPDENANDATERSPKDEWKKHATLAGRRTAVLHMPFMASDFLIGHRVLAALPDIINDVKKASNSDDPDDPDAENELEEDRNPKLYWLEYHFEAPNPVDIVREILFHMPPNAGKRWNKPWFQDSVSSLDIFIRLIG